MNQRSAAYLFFALFLLAIVPLRAAAQKPALQWAARYDRPAGTDYNDEHNALIVDAAGNVYVTGGAYGGASTTAGGTEDDVVTIKYNSRGAVQWVARYNGPISRDDAGTAIGVDAAGNVYVGGYSGGSFGGQNEQTVNEDFVTIKYNRDGVQQWVARYDGPDKGPDAVRALAVDAAGNVHLTGRSRGNGLSDYATLKYDANGNLLWAARYGGPAGNDYQDLPKDLALDGAGNVIVTGRSDSFTTGTDFATVKYDANGVQRWVQRYNNGGNRDDFATAVGVDAQGNVYVAGGSNSGSGNGGMDYVTIRYAGSDGAQQWLRRYNGPANRSDFARDLAVDGAGSVIVTGQSLGTQHFDFATVKYDANGTLAWATHYNSPPGNAADDAYAVAVDREQNVYVAGVSDNANSGFDSLTVKYDPQGRELWAARYNGPANGFDYAFCLAVDAFDNVYVSGFSADAPPAYDYVTLKYAQRSWSGQAVAVGADNQSRLLWTGEAGAAASLWTVSPDFAVQNHGARGPLPGWRVLSLSAAGSDNKSRLLWTYMDNSATIELLRPDGSAETEVEYGPFADWTPTALATGAGDNKTRLLWTHADGRASVWLLGPDLRFEDGQEFGPFPGWRPRALSVGGGDNKTRLLWGHTNGAASLWTLGSSVRFESGHEFGPFAGWTPRNVSASAGADNKVRLLWTHADGRASVWSLSASSTLEGGAEHGPFPGWQARSLGLGPDGVTRLLWGHQDGRASLWHLGPSGAFLDGREYGP
jgi:hypothetical protein